MAGFRCATKDIGPSCLHSASKVVETVNAPRRAAREHRPDMPILRGPSPAFSDISLDAEGDLLDFDIQ